MLSLKCPQHSDYLIDQISVGQDVQRCKRACCQKCDDIVDAKNLQYTYENYCKYCEIDEQNYLKKFQVFQNLRDRLQSDLDNFNCIIQQITFSYEQNIKSINQELDQIQRIVPFNHLGVESLQEFAEYLSLTEEKKQIKIKEKIDYYEKKRGEIVLLSQRRYQEILEKQTVFFNQNYISKLLNTLNNFQSKVIFKKEEKQVLFQSLCNQQEPNLIQPGFEDKTKVPNSIFHDQKQISLQNTKPNEESQEEVTQYYSESKTNMSESIKEVNCSIKYFEDRQCDLLIRNELSQSVALKLTNDLGQPKIQFDNEDKHFLYINNGEKKKKKDVICHVICLYSSKTLETGEQTFYQSSSEQEISEEIVCGCLQVELKWFAISTKNYFISGRFSNTKDPQKGLIIDTYLKRAGIIQLIADQFKDYCYSMTLQKFQIWKNIDNQMSCVFQITLLYQCFAYQIEENQSLFCLLEKENGAKFNFYEILNLKNQKITLKNKIEIPLNMEQPKQIKSFYFLKKQENKNPEIMQSIIMFENLINLLQIDLKNQTQNCFQKINIQHDSLFINQQGNIFVSYSKEIIVVYKLEEHKEIANLYKLRLDAEILNQQTDNCQISLNQKFLIVNVDNQLIIQQKKYQIQQLEFNPQNFANREISSPSLSSKRKRSLKRLDKQKYVYTLIKMLSDAPSLFQFFLTNYVIEKKGVFQYTAFYSKRRFFHQNRSLKLQNYFYQFDDYYYRRLQKIEK